MTTRSIVFLLLLASPTLAHLVPIQPSTCALDVRLSAPQAGLTATVDPPGPTDLVRTSYEPDANSTRSQMQVCPADPADPAGRCGLTFPARGFVAGAVSGTIALPSAFALRLLANGDLTAAAVPIAISVGANPPVTVPFDLGTGLVLVGTTPELGVPLDATGAFSAIGVGSSAALPPPLGGVPLQLGLSCTLAPVPDLDQFALAPRLTKVRGTLTTKKAKLTMVVESEVTMPADFAGVPTVLRLGPVDAPVLDGVAALVAGARGRFASTGGDLAVMPLKSKTSRLVRIVLKRTLTPGVPYLSGEGEMAISSGGLMATRAVSLKANRRGTRLVVHEH